MDGNKFSPCLSDQAAGNRRHEAAMKELAKRRQDQAAKVRASKGQVEIISSLPSPSSFCFHPALHLDCFNA